MALNNNNLYVFISITFLNFNIIQCQLNELNQTGKCVFFLKDSGSEIYNFHKYSDPEKGTHNFYSQQDISDWAINLCNDTRNPCLPDNINDYTSQIFYKNYDCKKLTGAWHRPIYNSGKIYYNKSGNIDQYIFQPALGDFCNIGNTNYSTKIIFEGDNNINNKKALIIKLPDTSICSSEMIVNVNLNYAKDYLILPKILNDYGIFTGIIFLLIGIYFCFLVNKFESLTKYITILIFSEIFTFAFELFIFNSTMKYLEIILAFVGLIIGIFLSLLSKKMGKNIFKIFLAANSGLIFGLFFFDIVFLYGNFFFINSMLIDTLLVFIILSITTVYVFPDFNIFYNSFFGSYILIRGISILISKIKNNYGYRDLQLLIYLINNYEIESANHYLTEVYKFFWIYDICISCLIIISIVYYKFNTKNNEEDKLDYLEEEENIEEENAIYQTEELISKNDEEDNE